MSEEIALGKRMPTVSQRVFRTYVRSLLTKSMDPEHVANRKAWLDICIDPRLRVSVLDDDTGKEIHQVPPITYTTDILTGRDISGTIQRWRLMQDVSPLHGERFAEDNIPADLITGKPPEEDTDLWREIYARYVTGNYNNNASANVNTDMLADEDDW